MPISTTWTFNLDLGDVMEEAFERCGLELRTGYDYNSARRSINLLTIEWQSRGLNLFTVKEGSQALTPGVFNYSLPAERFEIVEVVLRKNAGTPSQFDRSLNRISVARYALQSSKLLQSEPNVFAVNKSSTGITLKLWPVPDSAASYTLVYWYLERIRDAGTSAVNNVDIPPQYLPAFSAGLAHHVAIKNPNKISIDNRRMIEAEYEKQWKLASDSQRDRSTLRLVPKRQRI